MTEEAMKTWVEYGFTGLYVLISVSVIGWLFWDSKNNKQELVRLLTNSTTALSAAANAQSEGATATKSMQAKLEENTTVTRELAVYMKTRDQFGGRGTGRGERA